MKKITDKIIKKFKEYLIDEEKSKATIEKYIRDLLEAIKSGRTDVNMKGKLRVIIIPKDLCKMLKKYADEQKITSGSVFVTKTGRPLDRTNIWKLMKSLCESAGVDKAKVFPHNLRHLFARTFYSIEKILYALPIYSVILR